MNFWDQSHPLSAEAERLTNALMPSIGKASTLQGELIRASSRIGYDWYNNGWGCNNWSGAVLFLQENANILSSKRSAEERKAFKQALARVHEFSHGERADIRDDEAEELITIIHAYVVQNILDNPDAIPNEIDMLDLSEPNAPYEDEDEDDEEY